jgi:hypothetical protein
MADISIDLGDAFLLNTPPNGMHLYIAIAQISKNIYLFINATTQRDNSETTCILQPGSGVPNFITHESVIVYKYAREINATVISELIAEGNCVQKGSCSETVLMQIQQGGLVSRRLKNKYKTVLKNFLNTP